MLQLNLYMFLNQIFYGYPALLIIIIIVSKFILLKILSLYLSRIFIIKL